MNPIIIDIQPDFISKTPQPVSACATDSHDSAKNKRPVPHCIIASEESQRQARLSCELAERLAGRED